jgi:hypothetical protein
MPNRIPPHPSDDRFSWLFNGRKDEFFQNPVSSRASLRKARIG